MQEEQKQNTKNWWHLDVQEKDVGVNEENTINRDNEVTEVGNLQSICRLGKG